MRQIMVLILIMLLFPCTCFAESEYVCGDYEYVLMEDGTAQITDYTGKEEHLVLPETLDGFSVTGLGDSLLAGNYRPELVEIPDCIVLLENNPFAGSEICEIRVSESHPTLSVRDGVLFDKQGTCLIAYPALREGEVYSVPDGVETIGPEAFYSSDYMREVLLPDSLKSIGDDAFFASSVEGIVFSEGLTTIGETAFYLSDLKEVELPDSVVSIGVAAFAECYDLERVVLSENLEEIAASAFAVCESLTEISLPDGLISIGDHAFDGCPLSGIVLPGSVEYIGRHEEGTFITKETDDENPFSDFGEFIDGLDSDDESDGVTDWDEFVAKFELDDQDEGDDQDEWDEPEWQDDEEEWCTYCLGTGQRECGVCLMSGRCGSCTGIGHRSRYTKDGWEYITCSRCGGTGACSNCGYSGLVTCTICNGTGSR